MTKRKKRAESVSFFYIFHLFSWQFLPSLSPSPNFSPPLPDHLLFSLPPLLCSPLSSSNYQEEYEQNRTLHSFQVLERNPPGNYPARDEFSNGPFDSPTTPTLLPISLSPPNIVSFSPLFLLRAAPSLQSAVILLSSSCAWILLFSLVSHLFY